MESCILNLALTAFPAGDSPRRRPWVGSALVAASPLVRSLCFYINEEGTQLGQTTAVHREKYISACLMAWAFRHSCDQDNQEHIAGLAGSVDRANEFHNSRTVWQWARDMAGTALGPRGRFFALPDACRLTRSDWDHYMGATFEAQKVDTPKAHVAPPGSPLTKIRLADLRRALLRQRNFNAT